MSEGNAIALMNLAVISLRTGHDEEAVRCFKSSLKLKPDLVEAYIGLGLAYGLMDKYVAMAESFRNAIKTDQAAVRKWVKSSLPEPHVWLSFSPEYAHITGKMAEFLHDLDEADALSRLATTHISRGLDEAAVTALEYCLKLIPNNDAAITLLSIAYLFLESKEAGAATRIGKNSTLKKMKPKLAKSLFR